MPVYLIADIEVTDAEAFARYQREVPATIAAHGGVYRVRGGAPRPLEGGWQPALCVVVEFPDRARFDAWWDSAPVQVLRRLRGSATRSRMILVEGVEAAGPAGRQGG